MKNILKFLSFQRWSLRFRLTGMFVLIFGGTLIGISLVLFKYFSSNQSRDFDAALYNYAVDMAGGIGVDFWGDLQFKRTQNFEERKVFPFTLSTAYFQISDISGRVLVKSRSLGSYRMPLSANDSANFLSREILFKTVSAKKFPSTVDKSAKNYRVIAYLVKKAGQKPHVLQIAVPMTFFEKSLKGLKAFFWFFVPIVFLIAAIGGYFLSGKAMAPIRAIVDTTQKMDASLLSERVPVPDTDDEIRKLSLTLNDLLNRIQLAFASQERFISDVSHEMKTPLAILRGELDMICSGDRTKTEMDQFLQSTQQELEHITNLVENLLVLARVDAGVSCLSRSQVRMDELAIEVCSRVQRLAKKKSIKITQNLEDRTNKTGTNSFETPGDAGLIQCMLKNLIENAIKYSEEDSLIEVTVVDGDTNVFVAVKDYGKGMDSEEQQKMFERFYRSKNVDLDTRGSGLGLHLVKRIAEIHQVKLSVESAIGSGSNFSLEFQKDV